jgi:DNA invertase Pin-like site-specific DNA recombinase
MTREGGRAVGYVRVSTREQAQEGVSLAAQEERIRAYCTARGWDLIRVYRDEGESGSDLDRPGVRSMIRDLKANGVDVVVVLKLDRLTRSMRDLGYLIEDLFGGRALAAVDGSLDSSTPSGELVVNMLGAAARWERETAIERTKAALDYKRSRGEWLGRIPFGFRIDEAGKLAEDPEAMRVVAAIKRSRRRSGTSYPKLAKQYGLSVGLVYKLCTTDLRVLRREAKV